MYSWFTDALLSKNGIVKVWWDEYEDSGREEYSGLDEIGLQSLLMQDGVEVLEHSEYLEGDVKLHDVVIRKDSYDGRIKIENVPPSEFLISRNAKSIPDARFVCHRVQKTLSELREMYPDDDLSIEDLSGGGDDGAFFGGKESRFGFCDTFNFYLWES